MDKVIVTGLLVIAGVITAVILSGALRTSVEDAAGTTKTQSKQAERQMKSGMTILQVVTSGNGQQLDIWVKNTGSTEIKPLEEIDVFLTDIEGNWGDFVTYLGGGPVGNRNTWRVFSPVGVDWDPGITFQLRAFLSVNPVLNRTGYNLSITSPDSYTTKYRFDSTP